MSVAPLILNTTFQFIIKKLQKTPLSQTIRILMDYQPRMKRTNIGQIQIMPTQTETDIRMEMKYARITIP